MSGVENSLYRPTCGPGLEILWAEGTKNIMGQLILVVGTTSLLLKTANAPTNVHEILQVENNLPIIGTRYILLEYLHLFLNDKRKRK